MPRKSELPIPVTRLTAERLQHFYTGIFLEMESLIERYQSFGNWAVGGIPRLVPVSTQKELGLWYAEGHIPGIAVPGAVSIALVPGDTRLGLFLPRDALPGKEYGVSLTDRLATSYDGHQPQTVTNDPSRVLFDRYFSRAPFDAGTLANALKDPAGVDAQIIVQRLAYMVISLWSQAIRVLYADGKVRLEEYVVYASGPLSAEDVSGLPGGILISTYDVSKDGASQHASYIRTSATAEQIQAHLRERGMLESTVEPFSEFVS